VAADGAVARWQDKSGNSRHATQSASGNRPLRKTNQQNGLTTLLFDGTNDALSVPSSTSTFKFLHNAAYTVFVVFKAGSGGDPNRLSPIITTIDSFGGNPGIVIHHEDRASITPAKNDALGHMVKNNSDNRIQYFTDNDTFASNVYGVMTATGDVASGTPSQRSVLYRNGVSIGSNATASDSGSSSDSQADLTIGAAAAQFWFLGNIGEVIIYNSAISSTDRSAVESYLMSKWAIS